MKALKKNYNIITLISKESVEGNNSKNTAQMKCGNIVFAVSIKGREDQERTNNKEDSCKRERGGKEKSFRKALHYF